MNTYQKIKIAICLIPSYQADQGVSKYMSNSDTPTNHTPIDERQYKDYCQIIDCYERWTESIRVSAGKFGIIHLKVCRKCRRLFEESGNK